MIAVNKSWARNYFAGQPGLEVHPFWHKYDIPGINPAYHYGLGIYIGFICVLGTLGNLLVLYLFITTKNLRSPSNLFIISLALSDATFSAINGFPLLTISSFYKKWIFGKLACKLYSMIGGIAGFASINAVAFIAFDRFFVIAYPFDAMKKMTKKRAALQILFLWIYSIAWALPPLFGWGAYIPEGFQTSCSFDYLTRSLNNMSYVFSMFSFGFVLPASITIICYINIVRAVSNQAKTMSKTAEKMGAKTTKDDHKQEIRLAKIAAGTFGLFLISWSPYATVTIGGMAGHTWLITPYSCELPVMFAKMSAVYNPLLYALSHPKFRAALNEKVPWLTICCPVTESTSKSTRSGIKSTTAKQSNDSSTAVEMETVVASTVTA